VNTDLYIYMALSACITDGVLYVRVIDPVKASYGVDNALFAISQLAQVCVCVHACMSVHACVCVCACMCVCVCVCGAQASCRSDCTKIVSSVCKLATSQSARRHSYNK